MREKKRMVHVRKLIHLDIFESQGLWVNSGSTVYIVTAWRFIPDVVWSICYYGTNNWSHMHAHTHTRAHTHTQSEREGGRKRDNTLLHRDKDLSMSQLFCKSVSDDKHSNTQYIKQKVQLITREEKERLKNKTKTNFCLKLHSIQTEQ